MPVILVIQEAEIRRIKVKDTPRKQFLRPYLQNIQHKNRAGGLA
jgi:hypothetical protein